MTTRKDVIRQASLFTMNGLVDPRLMPDYIKVKATAAQKKKTEGFSVKKFIERIALLLSSSKGWQ